MAVNPDPRPGRWILPLVILGMIAFTYFFVRELPGASTETTLVTGPTDGSTTTTTTGEGNGVTSTTVGTFAPEVQAYLDAIDTINQELQVQRTEMVTVNTAFNQDPREVEYSEAEDRFVAVAEATQALADQVRGLTPPAGLETNHEALQSAIDRAAVSADEALAGLRSTDTGEQRNAAVEAYVTAATDFDTEVTNTHNAAGA